MDKMMKRIIVSAIITIIVVSSVTYHSTVVNHYDSELHDASKTIKHYKDELSNVNEDVRIDVNMGVVQFTDKNSGDDYTIVTDHRHDEEYIVVKSKGTGKLSITAIPLKLNSDK